MCEKFEHETPINNNNINCKVHKENCYLTQLNTKMRKNKEKPPTKFTVSKKFDKILNKMDKIIK